MTGLRICLIASNRFPIREPFAGGLEAQTHALASALTNRGHRVALFAGPDADPALDAVNLSAPLFWPSSAACTDFGAPPAQWMADHHAYLSLMLELAAERAGEFDLVHNNSLHYLPVAMAHTLPVPLLTTLHTPPLPWLESALAMRAPTSTFVAVSDFCRRTWTHSVDAVVVRNGVDTSVWTPGPGGREAVWSGRITPEKAPHEAIDACRLLGIPLRLVGPISNPAYYTDAIAPRLGDGVTHLGHLAHRELCDVVRRSSVALVTPDWDEPYGLVAAEAMACGTPVAAYARGALPEVLGDTGGVLATPGDVEDLARAATRAVGLDRGAVRDFAVRTCSLTAMVDQYEALYQELAAPSRAA